MMAVPLDVRNLRGIGFRDGACLQTRAVPFSFHCIFFFRDAGKHAHFGLWRSSCHVGRRQSTMLVAVA